MATPSAPPTSTEPLPEIATSDRPYRRFGVITLFVTFVLLLGWAAVAPLQSAVIAGGRVVVASQNKTVQHLDGGLVAEIGAREGDIVEQGQMLLRLDREPLEIQLDSVRQQLLGLDANLERLTAEQEGETELLFSTSLRQRAESNPGVLETQLRLFSTRREAMASGQAVLKQRIAQSRDQIGGLKKLITTLNRRVDLLSKDLQGLKQLAADNLVSQSQLRELQRKISELEGDIATHDGEISRLQETIAETEHQMVLRKKEHKKEVVTRQRDLQSQRISFKAEERAVQDKLSRIEIRAPVAGKIKGMKVVTLGAVIEAGTPITDIVPLERNFVIQAQVSPMDIDVLHPGQKAEVRLSVFDGSLRFPSLHADLEDISTDVYTPQGSDQAYYKARLALDGSSMGILSGNGLSLVSGMPVEVIIKTGERTLLEYLFKPFDNMLARALNEA